MTAWTVVHSFPSSKRPLKKDTVWWFSIPTWTRKKGMDRSYPSGWGKHAPLHDYSWSRRNLCFDASCLLALIFLFCAFGGCFSLYFGFCFVQENASPEDHGVYVWDHFIAKAAAKHVAIIAHSYGGIVTTNLVRISSQPGTSWWSWHSFFLKTSFCL